MTFFQKRYFIQNWSVIKTTWYAHPKKYIFKIKLWYSNFHQILPRYVTVKFTLKNGNLEKWSYLLVIDLLYLQLADAGWLQNIPEPTDHWWPAGDMDSVTLGAVVFLGTLSAQLETNFHEGWSETFGRCLAPRAFFWLRAPTRVNVCLALWKH